MRSHRAVWTRVLSLAWPVMSEQTLRTLMRAVDIVVTATFSPVAAWGFRDGDWAARAADRMDERATTD
ncbi:hypothetical protein [Salarchaeum japonicum]|uniref:Uncharacterized protein n=1 Tax=Salarchaeum japonicum TaxID=555573 RepID=A0AAV3SZZ4_9EURY|nr:hypothetical protein [Salarchaeum japonicum]